MKEGGLNGNHNVMTSYRKQITRNLFSYSESVCGEGFLQPIHIRIGIHMCGTKSSQGDKSRGTGSPHEAQLLRNGKGDNPGEKQGAVCVLGARKAEYKQL